MKYTKPITVLIAAFGLAAFSKAKAQFAGGPGDYTITIEGHLDHNAEADNKRVAAPLCVNERHTYKKVYLPDSSEVILNHNSSYARCNDSSLLDFYGEGFFKIRTQKRLPLYIANVQLKENSFAVKCESAAVFNLNTYDLQNKNEFMQMQHSFRVTCYAGKVEVHFGNQRWSVPAGSSYVFAAGNVHESVAADCVNDSVWFNNRYHFKQISLPKLAALAKQLYGVEISVSEEFANILFEDFSFAPNELFYTGLRKELLKRNRFTLHRSGARFYKLKSI